MKISRFMLALAIVVAAIVQATPAQAAAINVCYKAYERGNGWEGTLSCNGHPAGTVGEARPLEAVIVQISGMGTYCARAHLRDYGWEDWQCVWDGEYMMIGNYGETVEAVEILVEDPYVVCGSAHVTELGWRDSPCSYDLVIGTTGLALWMEALKLWRQ